MLTNFAMLLVIFFMMPFALFGVFVFVKLFSEKKAPMDASNRINHIRLVWFAINRPELFADVFEWLKSDELDNITQKEK